MSKRYLVIVNRAPGVGTIAREAIDLLLVAGAFDLEPAVLFVDLGVQHFASPRGGADPRPIDALETYGITRLYADAESLRRARLTAASLEPAPVVVDGAAIARLIGDADVVLTA
jgi:sulfur relay (sulfurtransferase) DsrF/TusC family protein